MIYATYKFHNLSGKMIANKKVSVIIVTNMHLIIEIPQARLLSSTILTNINESNYRVSAFFFFKRLVYICLPIPNRIDCIRMLNIKIEHDYTHCTN